MPAALPEVSWFGALCDDDYEHLGRPDPALASSWDHCRSIVAAADRNGFDAVLLPSGYSLGIDATAFAAAVGPLFAASAATLWVMGLAYNVPPVRLKEWPYLDVLSESFNNPLRLALGWFALIPDRFPPVSLALSYWMVGAFFMAMKRLAELRHIRDRAALGAYRKSFRYYTEERLLVSILFYVSACALFGAEAAFPLTVMRVLARDHIKREAHARHDDDAAGKNRGPRVKR